MAELGRLTDNRVRAALYYARRGRLERLRDSAEAQVELEADFGSPTDLGSTGSADTVLAGSVEVPVRGKLFVSVDQAVGDGDILVGVDTTDIGEFISIRAMTAGEVRRVTTVNAGSVIRLARGSSAPALNATLSLSVDKAVEIATGEFT